MQENKAYDQSDDEQTAGSARRLSLIKDRATSSTVKLEPTRDPDDGSSMATMGQTSVTDHGSSEYTSQVERQARAPEFLST